MLLGFLTFHVLPDGEPAEHGEMGAETACTTI